MAIFQRHFMSSGFREIDRDFVALDARDAADIPGSVEHEISHIEDNVLFEIVHRLVQGPVRLADVWIA